VKEFSKTPIHFIIKQDDFFFLKTEIHQSDSLFLFFFAEISFSNRLKFK